MPLIPETIEQNNNFIGRGFELELLSNYSNQAHASTIIVYGRRRIGKTELLEQAFRKRNILKFEGVENAPESEQRGFVMRQLSKYANEPLLAKIATSCWLDVFDSIHQYTTEGTWTIYFEEVQWLAQYNDNFMSELKLAWDNQFRRNNHIILILCGSSPSFMIKQVLRSKAFYNRSQHEIHLREFSIHEAKQLLANKNNREVMNAYLTVGGIPEYLRRLKLQSSVFSSLCEQSFLPNSYFSQEYERIFVSSLGEDPHYKIIIEALSRNKFLNRKQIAYTLNKKPGGWLTTYLDELELCGFIKKYTPYNLGSNSKLARYQVSDAYLQFYFKFIRPERNAIADGHYASTPTAAIKMHDYQQWLGYAFERYCRSNHHLIADILKFSGIKYKAGAFYNKAAEDADSGYQLDLVFDRDDHVISLCEIKYTQSKIGTNVIDEFEKKLSLFPNTRNKSIHKVLICAEGIDKALHERHYFDAVVTLDDLFK